MVLVLLAGQMDGRGSSEITNCLLRLFSENKRGGNKIGFMAGQWPKQKNRPILVTFPMLLKECFMKPLIRYPAAGPVPQTALFIEKARRVSPPASCS
jgi:hypothetical protein